MADIPIDDSALPPKLDLRKKAAPAPSIAPKAPARNAVNPAQERTSNTARIKISTTSAPAPENAEKKVPVAPAPTPRPKTLGAPGKTVRLTARPIRTQPTQPNAPATAETVAAKPITVTATPAAAKPLKAKQKSSAIEIPRLGAEVSAQASSKRKTSKIPLESATATSVGPKTIKIAPIPKDLSARTSPIAIGSAGSPDLKRQTSRISLEAALGSEGENKAEGPKTIRLKRPSEAPTIRVQKAPTADAEEGDLHKTAEIELPQEADDTPDTQKKTIKVRRPSQRRSVKSVSVKRSADGSNPASATPMAASVARPAAANTDSAHWTFITASIAAMIVTCVTIYVLCAQVLGPNISLTKLAYWAPDAELPWPGRIAR